MSPKNSRPNIGLLYLRGLAVYSYYRTLDTLESLRQRLLAPVRGLRRQVTALKTRWQHRRNRWLGTLAILIALILLTGGAILLYWHQDTVRAGGSLIVARIRQLWRQLRQPALVIVTGQTEEIPVMPGLNSPERR